MVTTVNGEAEGRTAFAEAARPRCVRVRVELANGYTNSAYSVTLTNAARPAASPSTQNGVMVTTVSDCPSLSVIIRGEAKDCPSFSVIIRGEAKADALDGDSNHERQCDIHGQ